MIGVIGVGNMGSAILHGLARKGFQLIAFDKKKLSLAGGIKQAKSLSELSSCRAIFLCVKPKDVPEICLELRKAFSENPHPLIISIAAAKTLLQLEEALGGFERIIRCMPNIAAKVGASATCFAANKNASAKDVELAKELFSCFGSCIEVDEAHLDAVTALSGCGPAYFFFFTQALAEAGVSMGLDKDSANALAKQTLAGSARLLEHENEKSLEQLISSVATPGGATEAALEHFRNNSFKQLVREAARTAKRKCEERSKGPRS